MNKNIPMVGVILGMLLMTRPAVADSISLSFAGTWGFYDPQQDGPTFWAAMAAYGTTTGTSTTFSMTIDDTFGAIQQVAFNVGSLSLGCEGAACSPQTNGSYATRFSTGGLSSEFMTAPSMTGLPSIGYGFFPSFFDFRAGLPLTATSLADALKDPSAWVPLLGGTGNANLLVGFSGSNGGNGVTLGVSNLTFVSETRKVPEPTSLLFLSSGLFLLVLFKARFTG